MGFESLGFGGFGLEGLGFELMASGFNVVRGYTGFGGFVFPGAAREEAHSAPGAVSRTPCRRSGLLWFRPLWASGFWGAEIWVV